MTKVLKSNNEENNLEAAAEKLASRRTFLKYSSAAALTAFAFGALSPEKLSAKMAFSGLPIDDDKAGVVDVGKGDIGILNFVYANEQLEAAFYTQVMATRYASMTSEESAILTDIRDNEIAHREFFRAQLGKKAIPALQVNFTSVNFNSRQSVLQTAQMFEDNGTAALNGGGQLLKNPLFLLIAGKLVSVEARHAAILRDLQRPMSAFFAGDDITDPATGLDPARTPAQALAVIKPFVVTPVSIARLPQPKA